MSELRAEQSAVLEQNGLNRCQARAFAVIVAVPALPTFVGSFLSLTRLDEPPGNLRTIRIFRIGDVPVYRSVSDVRPFGAVGRFDLHFVCRPERKRGFRTGIGQKAKAGALRVKLPNRPRAFEIGILEGHNSHDAGKQVQAAAGERKLRVVMAEAIVSELPAAFEIKSHPVERLCRGSQVALEGRKQVVGRPIILDIGDVFTSMIPNEPRQGHVFDPALVEQIAIFVLQTPGRPGSRRRDGNKDGGLMN
jgi:hypothetical protein